MTRLGVVTALAGVCICVVLAATGCAPSGYVGEPATPSAGATAPSSVLPRPDHVLVVVLENKSESQVIREAPYLAGLAGTGAALTDMHAETHSSQPNYLALFAGDQFGIPDDSCPHTITAPNLASELLAAGLSFAAYSEDLPEPGYPGCRAGGYVRKHSPWTNFTNVPATVEQPLTAMPTDFAALPTVAFLIPNLCHDMHDCPVAAGDDWLRQTVDPYLRWAMTHHSVLIVTFDESGPASADNHIATVLVGRPIAPGPVPERADHYRLLRTIEDMYGLPPLGHSATTTALTGIWRA